MESENQKNVTLLSATKEDTTSDQDSKLAVHDKSIAPVITVDSDFEEMNTETNISTATEKDSGVIYISDHEYDSDFEYRRKTNKPGPKSKTRYKLSQDEINEVRARYGNKKPRFDSEFADTKGDTNIVNSSDSSAKVRVSNGQENSDTNETDGNENKEEGSFLTSIKAENDKVKINSKETSINEDPTITLVAENGKNENVDEKDSKPPHVMEENGTLKTTCEKNCDEKEESSSTCISLGTDPKIVINETIDKKDDTVMPLIEDKKIMNKDNLDNSADKEVNLDADICPGADLQKSAIEEGLKNNIS